VTVQDLAAGERFACALAERVLGVRAEPWDVAGRQNAVDAMLTYPDGRRAAFEVITLGSRRQQQLWGLLGRDQFGWALPGAWWWHVDITDPRDLPRLRRCFDRVVLLCEAHGVSSPDQLPREVVDADADVRWMTDTDGFTLTGVPELPADDGNRRRRAAILPSARGGIVDHDLAGLHHELADAFAAPPFPAHFAKLLATPAEERHLYMAVHLSALSPSVLVGLTSGNALPPVAPPVPAGITHLWLMPQFGRRVLLWDTHGWRQPLLT
jgi:hypothetical protein